MRQKTKALQAATAVEMLGKIQDFLNETPQPYIKFINFSSDMLLCLIIYR